MAQNSSLSNRRSHAECDAIITVASSSHDQSSSIEQSTGPTPVPSIFLVEVDVASSLQEDPVQPVNHLFPSILISNKERCFNPKWYEQYRWLEYSVAKDAVFCYPCRLFAHGSNKAEDRFVTIGYRDWKHAIGKGGAFVKHNTSKHHQDALMNWSQYKATVTSGTSVVSRLDNARKEQIKKNRHYLKAMIHASMFCATQEVALRGHRESISSQSHNKGNFLEVVGLLAVFDPIIHKPIE